MTGAAALPIVAVTGTVGKTTTVWLLDHLVRASGRRTVVWQDDGVAIDGLPEPGELGPWRRGLALLMAGELDLAIQELAAATVQATGLPVAAYVCGVVTNLALNDETLLSSDVCRRQAAANQAVAAAVHADGVLVLNADDLAVADLICAGRIALFALRRKSPPLERHLAAGGDGLYVDGEALVWESAGQRQQIVPLSALRYVAGGANLPLVQNTLAAVAGALALGLPTERVSRALVAIDELPHLLDRRMAVRRGVLCRVIVGEAREALAYRALARFAARLDDGGPMTTRLLAMVAWPSEAPAAVQRIAAQALARVSDLLVIHGPGADEAVELVRQLGPRDRLPTFCVGVPSEVEAARRLVTSAASGDRLLLVGGRAPATLALLESYVSDAA